MLLLILLLLECKESCSMSKIASTTCM